MQISKKSKTFSEFSLQFCNLHNFFDVSTKKLRPIASIFPKLWTPNEAVTSISKRSVFGASLGSQRGNGFQTRLKSVRQNFYPLVSSL